MFEKVNPSHPDKIADRIAGAIVDLAYTLDDRPKIAVELTIGHGQCYIVTESSVDIATDDVAAIVHRIAGSSIGVIYNHVPQDVHLACNQAECIHCGDNGIFKGTQVTLEQKRLTDYVANIYEKLPYDGKYIIFDKSVIACQSYTDLTNFVAITKDSKLNLVTFNPLGDWTGGINVDAGAVNRKLGSDMGDSITGGGLFGKDYSKADTSVNIYAWLKSQICKRPIELLCAIGDYMVDARPYSEIVDIAQEYIQLVGGFEKFAEWGLIRPGYETYVDALKHWF